MPTFAVFGGDLSRVNALFVPLIDGGVLFDLLILLPLMLEGRSLGVQVPGRIRDVLRDVRVDVLPLLVYGGGGVTKLPLLLQLLLSLEVFPGLFLPSPSSSWWELAITRDTAVFETDAILPRHLQLSLDHNLFAIFLG